MDDYISGIFIRELKNRFLCLVRIENQEEVCYVPSSCHLSNFLDLKEKEVLLIPNKAKDTRTRFSLFAVPYKKNYIVLNTSMANSAIERCIRTRRFSFLGERKTVEREYKYYDYKCDFYIKDSNTIIEVKSIISTQNTALFPTVYSERSIVQLQQLQGFMSEGIKVVYCIVSLHPYIERIKLDEETIFYNELKKSIDCGLRLKAYTSRLIDGGLRIDKEIVILH